MWLLNHAAVAADWRRGVQSVVWADLHGGDQWGSKQQQTDQKEGQTLSCIPAGKAQEGGPGEQDWAHLAESSMYRPTSPMAGAVLKCSSAQRHKPTCQEAAWTMWHICTTEQDKVEGGGSTALGWAPQ